MRKLISMLLVLLVAMGLFGCGTKNESAGDDSRQESHEQQDTQEGSREPTKGAEAGEDDKQAGTKEIKKIGFAIDDLSTDFGSNMAKGIQDACDERGIELIISNSQGVSNTQISQVENMITAGCEAIILKPGDISALDPLSVACVNADVPLIVLTTTIGSEYTAAVLLDSEAVGAAKAQAIIDKCGKDAKVAMLLGPLSNENGNIMQDAAKEVFAENGVEVVCENIGDNKRDTSITVVENWISANYEFDAILASNDASALGAASALEEYKMLDDVFIIGTGGNLEGLQGIQDGKIDATMYTPPTIFAQYGVELAVSILTGEDYEKDFCLPCIVIDASNVEEYIKFFQ